MIQAYNIVFQILPCPIMGGQFTKVRVSAGNIFSCMILCGEEPDIGQCGPYLYGVEVLMLRQSAVLMSTY